MSLFSILKLSSLAWRRSAPWWRSALCECISLLYQFLMSLSFNMLTWHTCNMAWILCQSGTLSLWWSCFILGSHTLKNPWNYLKKCKRLDLISVLIIAFNRSLFLFSRWCRILKKEVKTVSEYMVSQQININVNTFKF